MPTKKPKKRSFRKILYAILIAFGIISFWRGAWYLLDIYLFPNNHLWSAIASVILGILILYSTERLIESFVRLS